MNLANSAGLFRVDWEARAREEWQPLCAGENGRPELQPAKQDMESLRQPGAKKASLWSSAAPWPPHTVHLQAWKLS